MQQFPGMYRTWSMDREASGMQALAKELKQSHDSVQHIVSTVNSNLWKRYEKESWIKHWQQPELASTLHCGPLYLPLGQNNSKDDDPRLRYD